MEMNSVLGGGAALPAKCIYLLSLSVPVLRARVMMITMIMIAVFAGGKVKQVDKVGDRGPE